MPSETDIQKAATEGKEFEMNFREVGPRLEPKGHVAEALRVPFIREPDPEMKTEEQWENAELREDVSTGDLNQLRRLPHRMKTMVQNSIEAEKPTVVPGGPIVTSLNAAGPTRGSETSP